MRYFDVTLEDQEVVTQNGKTIHYDSMAIRNPPDSEITRLEACGWFTTCQNGEYVCLAKISSVE